MVPVGGGAGEWTLVTWEGGARWAIYGGGKGGRGGSAEKCGDFYSIIFNGTNTNITSGN